MSAIPFPENATFRQLDIFGTSVPMGTAHNAGAIPIDNAGQTECECGQESTLVIVGRRYEWVDGTRQMIPIWANDCCAFYCGGEHVSSHYSNHYCENCDGCGDCCECSFCSSCENMVDSTETCGECERCCEHLVCGRCDSHTSYGCSECERCDDCCECVYCIGCDERVHGSTSECCNRCAYCCECEPVDDDESEIEIALRYDPSHASRYLCDIARTVRTFGVELEHAGISAVRAASVVNAQRMPCRYRGYTHDGTDQWKIVDDSSVSNGAECVSPILSGNDGLAQLSSVMMGLRANGADVNGTCGTHVHIGVDDLSAIDIVRIVKFYDAHHSLIDLLHNPRRRGSSSWSGPHRYGVEANRLDAVATLDLSDDERKREFRFFERYRSVNLTAFAKYGTLEFRQHGGTLNYTKLSAWLGFLFALIECAVDGGGLHKDLPSLLSTLRRYGLTATHETYLLERAAALSTVSA